MRQAAPEYGGQTVTPIQDRLPSFDNRQNARDFALAEHGIVFLQKVDESRDQIESFIDHQDGDVSPGSPGGKNSLLRRGIDDL
jgi:hypothetical protein